MKLTRRQLRSLIENTIISEEKGILGTTYDYWAKKTLSGAGDDVIGLAKDVAIPDAVARKYNAYRREIFDQRFNDAIYAITKFTRKNNLLRLLKQEPS